MTRAFAVCRIYDSGRRVIVRRNLAPGEATRVAGQLRDAMTDSQVGKALAEGWNYLPAKMTAAERDLPVPLKPLNYDRAKNRVRDYLASHTPTDRSRTQATIAAEMKRLGRKAVGRATT